MRNSKYLIKEAKAVTNTTDTEAISSDLCVRLLNRVQDYIQAYLFNQKKFFRETYEFSTVSGVNLYSLPHDIYGTNAVLNLMLKENDQYTPVKRISEKSRGTQTGYFLSNNNIIFAPIPYNAMTFEVSYARKLPSIGRSYGVISAVAANTSITLDTGYENMEGVYDDSFSIVTSDGTIVKYNIPINQTGDTVLMSDTSSVTTGMYVVPGKYATTHCQLPDELESAVVMALENMINARMSSTDLPMSAVFSENQLNQIGEMFAENGSDPQTPPIVEFSEWV